MKAPHREEWVSLRAAVRELRDAALVREHEARGLLAHVHPNHHESARNLLHYAALRGVDLRDLQRRLSALGLSSLGRSEAHVLATLRAVEGTLSHLLEDREPRSSRDRASSVGASSSSVEQEGGEEGEHRLERNVFELFGPAQHARRVRIMVTAPTAAASDPECVERLLREGMDVLRINCAKDDPDVWAKMVENVRRAETATGRRCRITCDLAGPKLRTGPIAGPGKIRLECGDQLWITRRGEPGRGPRTHDVPREQGTFVAFVSCAAPAVVDDLEPGQRVFFDDGKFGGRVARIEERGALILLDHSPPDGGNLRSDKGINLPDTRLSLPALTQGDLEALHFIARYADIVGQSFLRGPEDVQVLTDELGRRGAHDLGLVLKLETPTAFSRLPEVLLAGLAHRRVGAMVARGDLAVEVGFERLAEAQEEMLWMCEAAHMPVIWATQVLETLAKKGMPTRAEVTDAAMAGRAECVMLNKGKYIAQAVRFLGDVLERMESHQRKKFAHLRRLSISGGPRG